MKAARRALRAASSASRLALASASRLACSSLRFASASLMAFSLRAASAFSSRSLRFYSALASLFFFSSSCFWIFNLLASLRLRPPFALLGLLLSDELPVMDWMSLAASYDTLLTVSFLPSSLVAPFFSPSCSAASRLTLSKLWRPRKTFLAPVGESGSAFSSVLWPPAILPSVVFVTTR